MREHDKESLANIIASRVAGVKLVNIAQESFLANSQKVCAMGNAVCTPCYVTIYIDGLVFYSARPGVPPTDVSRISVSELAGMEFYRNASSGPVQYRTGSSECGTLLLWTREK